MHRSNKIDNHELPIIVPDDVDEFESSYSLPPLVGSARQIAWARLVRRQFLTEVFADILNVTCTLSLEDAKTVYTCLDEFRSNCNSELWVSVYRLRLGQATATLVNMAASRAARLAEERRLAPEMARKRRLGIENQRLMREAEKWETHYHLPEITGVSDRQVKFARRCRYVMFRDDHAGCHCEVDAAWWIESHREWTAIEAERLHQELDSEADSAIHRDIDQ